MIKYLRLPFAFDVLKMQQEVEQLLAEKWTQHYNAQQYEGDWQALPLRSVNGDRDSILALDGNSHFEDTSLMDSVPYIKQVVDIIQCPKLGIRLLNLKAGAIVHAHSDQDLYFEEGEARLHVPIVTNDLVEFYLDEERVAMSEGECWYMNLAMMHRLHNRSSVDRVHLVIDCKVNDWLIQQFNNPEIAIRKDVENFHQHLNERETQLQVIEQLRSMNIETAHQLANEMEASLK